MKFIIQSEDEYDEVVEYFETLIAEAGPNDISETWLFKTLEEAIIAWDDKHWPMDEPTPEAIAEFRADQEAFVEPTEEVEQAYSDDDYSDWKY